MNTLDSRKKLKLFHLKMFLNLEMAIEPKP